jgi:Sigma-70 region 2
MDEAPEMQPRWSSVEALFKAEFARLVRGLALVEGTEAAADAVQEAFIQADRQWRKVGRLVDPAAWVRRVAMNRLLNGRRNHRRRTEILAAVHGPGGTGRQVAGSAPARANAADPHGGHAGRAGRSGRAHVRLRPGDRPGSSTVPTSWSLSCRPATFAQGWSWSAWPAGGLSESGRSGPRSGRLRDSSPPTSARLLHSTG